jgi:predicted  nucleic acid-binding Zn-ribbon protein
MSDSVQFYCAAEQCVTAHTVETDGNGELLIECATPGCRHFLKLPASHAGALDAESQLYADANHGKHAPVAPMLDDDED